MLKVESVMNEVIHCQWAGVGWHVHGTSRRRRRIVMVWVWLLYVSWDHSHYSIVDAWRTPSTWRTNGGSYDQMECRMIFILSCHFLFFTYLSSVLPAEFFPSIFLLLRVREFSLPFFWYFIYFFYLICWTLSKIYTLMNATCITSGTHYYISNHVIILLKYTI